MIDSRIKTVILLGLLTGLLLWISSFWGQTGLIVGLAFAGLLNFGSYWFSDKIVLFMYRAKELNESEHPEVHRTVEEIAQLAKLPKPKLYLVNTPQANAFATGRNPKHAAVAVTSGILQLLNTNELKGVLAHELSHIKNRDILISSIAATIAGVISYVAMTARWAAIFGGFGSRDGEQNGGVIELLVLTIVTPIMATLIQLAIARSREFLADETGARTIRNPQGLASALQKIENSVAHHPLPVMGTTNATAHLFISNPFKGKGLFHLFMTHPPTKERIKRLQQLKL